MKKYLLALLPLAVIMTGCEDPCEKGIALRNDEATLEAVVNETILSPSTLGNTCYSVSSDWNKTLEKGASFATRVANNHFYYEERECMDGHYEHRCDFGAYPGGPYPGSPHDPFPYPPSYGGCDRVFVCDRVKTTPHTKDGYEQALEISRLLRVIKNNLGEACLANAGGNTVAALAALVQAKSNFASTEQNTDYVLNKAGCFDRSRRGD